MQSVFELWQLWLSQHPLIQTFAVASTVLMLAVIANFIVKKIILNGFYRALKHINREKTEDFGVAKRLANIVPALILAYGIAFVPNLPDALVTVIRNVCGGFIILTIAMAISAMLNVANMLYMRRKDAHLKPIKGYLQLLQIAVYAVATVLIIATLIDRSPLILLSGLGAMAAVLMLIFQDTLLSMVASVQINSGDMIRVGDWVEMPQQNADGDVIDIALHTVKIQNWDKTITSVPTKSFINSSFKNWRGMHESGGRRIKRSLLIDQQSIHFLTDQEVAHLRHFKLMYGYFDSKIEELNAWNQRHIHANSGETVDSRRMTNIGTFRAYVERYLRNHPGVHQNMTLMVRQLSPTPDGLPLEIYCFTNSTVWAIHEGTQSDIFDHLLAIAPEFGLRVYQAPSGADMSRLFSSQ